MLLAIDVVLLFRRLRGSQVDQVLSGFSLVSTKCFVRQMQPGFITQELVGEAF